MLCTLKEATCPCCIRRLHSIPLPPAKGINFPRGGESGFRRAMWVGEGAAEVLLAES